MEQNTNKNQHDSEFPMDQGNYFYYRGIAKYQLNDVNGALQDFKRSAELGCEKGKANYEKLQNKLSGASPQSEV